MRVRRLISSRSRSGSRRSANRTVRPSRGSVPVKRLSVHPYTGTAQITSLFALVRKETAAFTALMPSAKTMAASPPCASANASQSFHSTTLPSRR
jgi:hypothetical protein